MFFKSKIFNQEIGNWNVSSVTNMNRMFQKASFNEDIQLGRDNVQDDATFLELFAFNQILAIGMWVM